MSRNDVVLLNNILEQDKVSAPAGLDDSEHFEFFTSSNILKEYDLSNDEIEEGIIDGSGDGGIDGFYVFADENLVGESEDFDPQRLPTNYSLEVYIIQSKVTEAFGEGPIDKLSISLKTLLDLSNEPDRTLYSEDLLARMELFRTTLTVTANKFPNVRVNVKYATKGDTQGIHARTLRKAELLKGEIETLLGTSTNAGVDFVGARELLELARKQPSSTLELPFQGNATTTGTDSYVVLVPILAYRDFLADGSGKLQKSIFESNVRDFQGNTVVNNEIRTTLSAALTNDEPDFWWLNNGVTILCSEASITGGKFQLKDVQIVNGLQTSVSIYEHFKNAKQKPKDERTLLVRIITTKNDTIRNRVIVATNSQTTLLPSAIRATDPLQRDIEQHFLASGYFYDRRKNFYKNLKKPADKIIPVPYLSQAILSIAFSEPHAARARPSSLITQEAEYKRIFNPAISLDIYLWIAKLQKYIDVFLKTSSYETNFKSNMRFALAMLYARDLLKEAVFHPSRLNAVLSTNGVDEKRLKELAGQLEGLLKGFSKANPTYTVDRIAKSKEFTKRLLSVETW